MRAAGLDDPHSGRPDRRLAAAKRASPAGPASSACSAASIPSSGSTTRPARWWSPRSTSRFYGIRQDQASGRGAAIIATPDGLQRSFAVGEEIVPGVTLDRGRFRQCHDQPRRRCRAIVHGPVAVRRRWSGLPGAAGRRRSRRRPWFPARRRRRLPRPPPASPTTSASSRGRTATGDRDHRLAAGQRATAFRAAGFAPGDVIVRVNGRRIDSGRASAVDRGRPCRRSRRHRPGRARRAGDHAPAEERPVMRLPDRPRPRAVATPLAPGPGAACRQPARCGRSRLHRGCGAGDRANLHRRSGGPG